MKQLIRMFGVIILTMLVNGTSWAGNQGISDPQAAEAEWTIIYYLAADNDQEAYADSTINQLLAGTANTAVNGNEKCTSFGKIKVYHSHQFRVSVAAAGEAGAVLNSFFDKVCFLSR